MKTFLALFAFLFLSLPIFSSAQNFAGPVGIGTTTPATPLEVRSNVNDNLNSTEYLAAYSLGTSNDYGSGQAQQYMLLTPLYNGVAVNSAGLSGTLRTYRGTEFGFNAPIEYEIICQTAYKSTSINLVPKTNVSDLLNVYAITYNDTPYLALKGSDILNSSFYCTFTGYYWNNINSVRPQFVPATSCTNISVYQDVSYLAGPGIVVNSSGLGIGAAPWAPLHVFGSSISLDTGNYNFSGNMVIQANTGGRFTNKGAELEFALPANTDGTNIWGQARIATVAANTTNSSPVGEMVLGTRRALNKLGTGLGWYYGDDLVIDGLGHVGINTFNTQGHLLNVNGDAIFTKAIVKVYGSWPDYVFGRNYDRMPLDEVEAYIQRNGRLPGMPAAGELEKEGLDLGNMQLLQQEKIEELMLAAIEADKRAKAQDTVIAQLQDQMKALQEEVRLLKSTH